MKLIKIFRYNNRCVKIFDNGQEKGNFPFEYKFRYYRNKKSDSKIIHDRTSWNSLSQCISIAKDDIDSE